MTNPQTQFIEIGKATIIREAQALAELAEQLDDSFTATVNAILACTGHVLLTGAGTSATIARRMAHLLSCVGAPALYIDSGMGMHGGSGAITAQDIVIAFSRGGETDELVNMLGVARERQARTIAITAMPESTMAQRADIVLQIVMDPSTDAEGVMAFGSSLAVAIIGDAICAAVLSVHGYDQDEFRLLHPGGAVGKILNSQRDQSDE